MPTYRRRNVCPWFQSSAKPSDARYLQNGGLSLTPKFSKGCVENHHMAIGNNWEKYTTISFRVLDKTPSPVVHHKWVDHCTPQQQKDLMKKICATVCRHFSLEEFKFANQCSLQFSRSVCSDSNISKDVLPKYTRPPLRGKKLTKHEKKQRYQNPDNKTQSGWLVDMEVPETFPDLSEKNGYLNGNVPSWQVIYRKSAGSMFFKGDGCGWDYRHEPFPPLPNVQGLTLEYPTSPTTPEEFKQLMHRLQDLLSKAEKRRLSAIKHLQKNETDCGFLNAEQIRLYDAWKKANDGQKRIYDAWKNALQRLTARQRELENTIHVQQPSLKKEMDCLNARQKELDNARKKTQQSLACYRNHENNTQK